MDSMPVLHRPTEAVSLVQRLQELARELPDRPGYTFVDYLATHGGHRETLTWSEVDQRARAVAAVLRDRMLAGERVAVLAPQGLDYVVAMLGAFYARVVAVPLFTPDLPGHAERLARILDDARPACALTTSAAAPSVVALLRERSLPMPGGVVSVDEGWVTSIADWRDEPVQPADLAYLQYTSGSTRAPAGVMITHGCLAANAAQIVAALQIEPQVSTAVSWLPLFHDMGFVMTVAMPIACPATAIFTDPAHFLMRPVRWLELASGRPDVFTAGPNFAYDFCASRVSDAERATLDLSGVRAFINGAEPVRPASLRRFLRAFAGCGLAPGALVPAYGLAEATVCVALGHRDRPARAIALDRTALQRGAAVARGEVILDAAPAGPPDGPGADPSAVLLTSCGVPAGQQVAIVDPQTAVACPPGRVGEIWVNGPNVSPGYYRRPSVQALPSPGEGEAFGAVLAGPPPGLPATGWLRTGDTGVIYDGELMVTGRLKDLIIIDGRNHYPQDVEATAQDAHPAIRRDRVTAFAVEPAGGTAPGDGDRLVVIAECARHALAEQVDPADVAGAVRAAISTQHGITLSSFRLVLPGQIPRTSSGKLARSACRDRYLAGELVQALPSPVQALPSSGEPTER